MEVKAAGGAPDLAPAQQALDNMSKKLAEMKAISTGRWMKRCLRR
ncbi:hypothetical protein ACVXG7_06315 [Enterobacter hormaechei]